MKKRIIGVFALGVGIVLSTLVATPSYAHTGDLKAKAVCNTETGKYDVTYTLNLTQVGAGLTGETKWRIGTTNFDGTPTNADNMANPIASTGNVTLTLGTETYPGDTINGRWVYAYTKWNDGFGKGSDGRIEGLKGDCKRDKPSEPPTEQQPGSESEIKCDSAERITHNWLTVIEYRFDVDSWTWVPKAPNHVVLDDVVTALTDDEFFEECAPDKPEPEARDTHKETVNCVSDKIKVLTTLTTITPVWNTVTRAWDMVESVTNSVSYKPLSEGTAVQQKSCVKEDRLATTGVREDVLAALWALFWVLVFAGILVLVYPVLKKREKAHRA